ncbi:MAG TPA: rhomboid family intramembrane serine protease [Desulfobacteraceae bacterium]|nr:rhomboid family intramembrane serine protease [Desulfobacteraceae bacterium]
MSVVLKNLSEDDADTYRLVLSSTGISYYLREDGHRWDILVNDTDYEKALIVIEEYLEENPEVQKTEDPLYYEYQRTFTGIWVSILLIACHVAIATGDKSDLFVRTYGSSAFHILHGELYRSVTSLMLHAGPLHLMGNIAGIAIFGTAVCTIMGWGVGWFMILATGIVGNLTNALLYTSGHISVGASTAVFGAIGILSASQFFKKFKQSGQKIKAFLPLSCGLALLGILGSGEHSDLMAHLFGFLAGIVLGSLYSIFVKEPKTKGYQAGSLLLTLCLLAMAWLKAF